MVVVVGAVVLLEPGLVAAVAYLIAAAIGAATRKWWAWTASAIMLAVANGLAVAAIVPPDAQSYR